MNPPLRIFDAHLDLAMNVQRGRDVRRPALEQPPDRGMIATVGLPDLVRGHVTHLCATIFCAPAMAMQGGYHSADEAFAAAKDQIATYRTFLDEGLMLLPWHGRPARVSILNADTGEVPVPRDTILLIEGADCIRTPGDLPYFRQSGVRIVGLSWIATRYAGGTSTPGPLTPAGRELVREIDRIGFIHDASHLADESFWNLLDATSAPIIASHSNCRAIVGEDPGERHLSDEMIKALVARGGVIGINFFDKFLVPASEYGRRRATLDDVVRHIRHVCDLAGDARHVGIGSDMDGGLGRMEIPIEIETSADVPLLGQALIRRGFTADDVERILFGNWHDALIANAPQPEAV